MTLAEALNKYDLKYRNPEQDPATVFHRSDSYMETYKTRILPNPQLRTKFRTFMQIKRDDPQQVFGASDKPFVPSGKFFSAVPGLKHAHVTQDLSIVYLVDGNNIYLYGFYTHADLGTGQPAKRNVQQAMADKFKNTPFTEWIS